MRGLCGVVAFDDLGADTFAADQLLLGAQQVREVVVEVPDLVEELELGGGVETEVADEASDVGPVLLLDVAAVVLVAGPAPGEGDLVGEAVVVEMGVDELRTVVGIDGVLFPSDRKSVV